MVNAAVTTAERDLRTGSDRCLLPVSSHAGKLQGDVLHEEKDRDRQVLFLECSLGLLRTPRLSEPPRVWNEREIRRLLLARLPFTLVITAQAI